MTTDTWTLDPSTGGLLTIGTDVTGKAAKMGHRLTIAVTSWTAAVDWSSGEPTSVTLTAEVESLEVVSGEGGLTPLVGPEKVVAKANALKSFDAKRYPQIRFVTDAVVASSQGYTLTGTLEIHGETKEMVVEIAAEDDGDSWRLASRTVVRQSDFGIKPYSQMFGAMKVVDDVTVSFTAEYPKGEK